MVVGLIRLPTETAHGAATTLEAAAANPYRSPESFESSEPLTLDLRGPVHGVLLDAAWRYRRVRLTGGLEAEIEWNARWPSEFVRLNGQRVSTRHAFWYANRFEFQVATDASPVTITVEVRISPLDIIMWDALHYFAIRVQDQLAYCEGC